MKALPRRARFLATILLSAGVLAVVFQTTGSSEVWATLKDVPLRAVLLVLSASLLARFAEASLMGAILRRLGHTVGAGRIVLANLLSSFYSMFVPGDVVASAAKWADLSRATGDPRTVFAAIIHNRANLVLASLVLAIGASFTPSVNGDSTLLVALSVSALAILLGYLFLLQGVILRAPRLRLIGSIGSRVPAQIRKFAASFDVLGGLSLTDQAVLGVGALLASLIGASATYATFSAVGIEEGLMVVLWVRAILVVVRLLPISFNGLGVHEATLVILLGAYGIEPETAVAAGLLAFGANTVKASIGGVYQLFLIARAGRGEESHRSDRVSDGQSSG